MTIFGVHYVVSLRRAGFVCRRNRQQGTGTASEVMSRPRGKRTPSYYADLVSCSTIKPLSIPTCHWQEILVWVPYMIDLNFRYAAETFPFIHNLFNVHQRQVQTSDKALQQGHNTASTGHRDSANSTRGGRIHILLLPLNQLVISQLQWASDNALPR